MPSSMGYVIRANGPGAGGQEAAGLYWTADQCTTDMKEAGDQGMIPA